jgi:hypothetical protein
MEEECFFGSFMEDDSCDGHHSPSHGSHSSPSTSGFNNFLEITDHETYLTDLTASGDGNGSMTSPQRKLTKQEKILKKIQKKKQKLDQRRFYQKQQRLQKFQELSEEEKAIKKEEQRQEVERKANNLLKSYHSNLHICIDLGFLEENTEHEVRSLATQIRLSYVELKKNNQPLALHLSSFPPLPTPSSSLSPVLPSQGSSPPPPTPPPISLPSPSPPSHSSLLSDLLLSQGIDNWKIFLHEQSVHETFSPELVVYLSPDAEESLPELLPDHVYVIGGIVDKNIKRRLTLDTALDYEYPAYRLPVKEHYPSSKNTVLNVDQVVRALCVYNETKDWEAALTAAVPPRRRGETREKKPSGDGD